MCMCVGGEEERKKGKEIGRWRDEGTCGIGLNFVRMKTNTTKRNESRSEMADEGGRENVKGC